MGQRITRGRLQGLGVLASEISMETLEAVGTAATSSSYTQAGPAPGQAVAQQDGSRLVLEASGGHGEEIEVDVTASGLPGASGVRVRWRPSDESTDLDWRGRSEPSLAGLVSMAVFEDTSGEEWRAFDLIADPESGALVLIAGLDGATAATPKAYAYDWSTGAWGAAVDITTGTGRWESMAGVCLPGGRMLALASKTTSSFDVYLSEDGGTTWSHYAEDEGLTLSSLQSCCYFRGDLLLVSSTEVGGTPSIGQTVSTSLGTTWEILATHTNMGHSARVAAIGEQAIVVAYATHAADYPAVRILGAASELLSDADEVIVDTVALLDVAVSVDDLGSIYVYGRIDDSGGTGRTDAIGVWVSTDRGATFTRMGSSAGYGDAWCSRDDSWRRFAVHTCRGYHVLVGNLASTTTTYVECIGTVRLGGWDTLSHEASVGPARPTAPGWSSPSSGEAYTFAPSDVLGNQGWTVATVVATSAGTHAVADPGVFEVSCSIGQTVVLTSPTLGSGAGVRLHTCHRIDSGTPGVADPADVARLTISDGSTTYRLDVRFSTTALAVFDGVANTSLASVALDATEWVEVYAHITGLANGIEVYYRTTPGVGPWSTAYAYDSPSVPLTDAGATAAGDKVILGSLDDTVAKRLHWRFAYVCDDGLGPAVGVGDGYLSGDPAPLPEAGDGTRLLHLAAQRGPGVIGERWLLAPFYQYGIHNLFPTLSPSPDTRWRSTAKDADVDLVFDTTYGHLLGLTPQQFWGFIRANFRDAQVHVSNDPSVGWTSWATYDGCESGFSGLAYTLRGSSYVPASGSDAGGRALFRNELVGGYLLVGSDLSSSSQRARRIVGNSAGVWDYTTETLPVRIDVEGLDGSEGGTELDIVWPSGLLHQRVSGAPFGTATTYRYVRVRIPADQVTPDAYYEVGALLAGTAWVPGKRTSRGWSQGMAPNVDRRTSRYGTIRKRQVGPPARRWSMGWTDGATLAKIRGVARPDFLRNGGASYPPLALADDVWLSLWGVLEEVDGGALPVVALGAIPEADQVQCDRSLWLYGTASGTAQFNEVSGDEGVAEFGRIDPITVDELK